MVKQAAAVLAGLGLIGGAAKVTYDDKGTATVKVKDKNGTQTVRLYGDAGGKKYSCPAGTEEKLSPHDAIAGRITLTLRQVRRQESAIEKKYPGHAAPGPVADRYNGLIRRDRRLVSAFNAEVRTRNAIIDADCN